MATVRCRICDFENEEGARECVRCGTRIRPGVSSSDDATRAAESPHGAAGLRQGQIIGNRYEVLGEIGRGGMGSIYRARDNTLREEVALKTLLPQFVRDEHIVERFFNEARITRQLSHPNIVRVHDIGASQNTIYISMELMQGKSLRQLLEDQMPGDRIPIRQVMDIFIGLASALEYAHRYTVHRDIKPENVMVDNDGTVKLMDFGISKLMQARDGNLTSDSMVMGTPHYMSPEQVKHSARVDGRADIYSLGVMLYEVLTGNLPTAIHKPVSQISRAVPPALDPIIETCLQDDPNRRFQSAAELREALEEVREQLEGTGARSVRRMPRRGRIAGSAGGPPARMIVGIVLLAAVLGATAWGVVRAESARQRTLESLASASAGVTTEQTLVEVQPTPLDTDTATLLLPLARRQAETAARLAQPDRVRTYLESLLEDAAVWQAAAEAEIADGTGPGVSAALHALHRYAGIVGMQDGFVFVPPGDAPARLPGMFVAERYVSAAQFRVFADAHDWRIPEGMSGTGPCTGVTYYDALAYAAAQDGSFSLPTSEEWQRAIESAETAEALLTLDEPVPEASEESPAWQPPLYFAPDVYEWTSTVNGEPGASAMFDDELVVMTVRTDDTGVLIDSKDTQRYQDAASDVSFRLVESIPASNEGLRAFFGQ